jgi:hypothetical protein
LSYSKKYTGSLIGGDVEAQRMADGCDKQDIGADRKIVDIRQGSATLNSS